MNLPDDRATEVSDSSPDIERRPKEIAGAEAPAMDLTVVLALVAAEERMLRYVAYQITRCYEAVQNIMTDLRIRILERDGEQRFHSKDHMRAHVVKIVKNLALDWCDRQKFRNKVVCSADPYNHPDAQQGEPAASTDGSMGAPDTVTMLLEALRPHLERLTERQAEIFSLRIHGSTYQDIAVRLGMEPTTAKKHFHNAVRALKQLNLHGDCHD